MVLFGVVVQRGLFLTKQNKNKIYEAWRYKIRFPKDKLLREQWVKAVRRLNWEPGVYSVLCSEHFSVEFLNRTSACGRTELRENAVPTIFPRFPANLKPHIRKILKPPQPRAVDPLPITDTEPILLPSISEDIKPNIQSNDLYRVKQESEEPMEILEPSSKEVAVQIRKPPRPRAVDPLRITDTEPILLPSVSEDIKPNIQSNKSYRVKRESEEQIELFEPSSKEVAVQIHKPQRSCAVDPFPITDIEPILPIISEDIKPNIQSNELYGVERENGEPMGILEPSSKEVAVQVSGDIMMKEMVNQNKHLDWKLNDLKSKLHQKSITIKKLRKQNLRLNVRISSLKSLIKELKS